MRRDFSGVDKRTKFRLLARIYRTFLPYLKPYWLPILLAYASLLGTILMKVLEPWPLKLIFDHILWNKPLPDRVTSVTGIFGQDSSLAVTLFCVALVVVVLFKSLFTYINRYLLSLAGQAAINDIRLSIFDHLQSLSLFSLGSRRTGDLVLRLTSDIKSLRELLVNDVQNLGEDLFAFIITVAVMFWMDWRLTLVALTIVPPLLAISHYFSTQIEAAARKKQSKESEVASIVQETMTSMAVVQAFTQEKREKKRLSKESRESLQAALQSVRWDRAFNQLAKILNTCGTALVVWYGVSRVLAGKLTPGDIIVFTRYVGNLYEPINHLSDLIGEFMVSLVSGERLLELMEIDREVKDAPGAVKAPSFRGEVCFDQVTFGYIPGEPVLSDLSFVVKPGQTISLVGSSGTGKSTVVKLLLRFFDPWEGRILIDGEEIRRFKLKSLRSQISVVPQDPVLFRRTIGENIAYGKPEASFEEIVAAAEAAQAHSFIMQMPNGYETMLDERGENLSGGQRQRIALARAILKTTPLLILDEPASGLDAITEAQFYDALAPLIAGKTTFIIAHRLSTIQKSDVILVIEEGRAIERGTHAELLANSALYRQIYETQYRPFASADAVGSFVPDERG